MPFAGLARAGFIAMQILSSLKDVGVFSDQDHENFLLSLNTVGGQLANDQKRLKRKEFLKSTGISAQALMTFALRGTMKIQINTLIGRKMLLLKLNAMNLP